MHLTLDEEVLRLINDCFIHKDKAPELAAKILKLYREQNNE
jgi:hypothetical protein